MFFFVPFVIFLLSHMHFLFCSPHVCFFCPVSVFFVPVRFFFVLGPRAQSTKSSKVKVDGSVERELWDHFRIQVKHGKTQVWNRSGVRPTWLRPFVLQGRRSTQRSVAGRPHIAVPQAGCRHFGNPFGASSFRGSPALRESCQYATLLERIPQMQDLQCAWLLLLFFALHREQITSSCCSPRTEFPFRCASRRRYQRVPRTVVAHPSVRRSVANGHSAVCGTPRDCVPRHIGPADTLLVAPSPKDCRPLDVVFVAKHWGGVHLEAANECRTRLQGAGIDVPEWGDIDRGQRPGFHPDDEFPRFSRIRKRSSTL